MLVLGHLCELTPLNPRKVIGAIMACYLQQIDSSRVSNTRVYNHRCGGFVLYSIV